MRAGTLRRKHTPSPAFRSGRPEFGAHARLAAFRLRPPMSLHLLVPGLLWPAATAFSPVAGLALPGLERLLGLGKRRIDDFEPFEAQLAHLFHCASSGPEEGSLPLAALRRAGETQPLPAGEAHWLCADPVTLSFAREHMLLSELPLVGFSMSDAQTLIAELNDCFADLGQFEACTAGRWYLRLRSAPQVRFYPLQDVVGRPVKHFLPEGKDARLWQRVMNEAQIVLHNHALNRARDEAGLPMANSLWLWGAGAFTRTPQAPAAVIQGRDPLIRGLAQACALPAQAPDLASALGADSLVVLDELQQPALQRDIDAWRAALQQLESEWFAPLAHALSRGQLGQLRLSAPSDRGTLRLVLRASERWKFWRKPFAFDSVLKSLAPPAPTLPASGPAAERP